MAGMADRWWWAGPLLAKQDRWRSTRLLPKQLASSKPPASSRQEAPRTGRRAATGPNLTMSWSTSAHLQWSRWKKWSRRKVEGSTSHQLLLRCTFNKNNIWGMWRAQVKRRANERWSHWIYHKGTSARILNSSRSFTLTSWGVRRPRRSIQCPTGMGPSMAAAEHLAQEERMRIPMS